MTQKKRRRKKLNTFLTGFVAFVMTTTYFYTPGLPISDKNIANAATIGQIRTFNNTSTGRLGADVNNSAGTLGGSITMSGGMYNWTVPETGVYSVVAQGAEGGNNGGKGARIKGDFNLTKGETIRILVGQAGTYSGAGGSFVTKAPHNTNASILVIAGGGGGGHSGAYQDASSGQTGTSGGAGTNGATGGDSGNGGGAALGAGGAGFFSNGGSGNSQNTLAQAYVNGGAGGVHNSTLHGGFGGGGAAGSSHGGGGGGYSGGGGSTNSPYHGGGGGSYNNGTNQSNTAGVKTGHGQVTITFIEPTITSQSPANGTKFQNNYIDVSWSNDGHSKYEIKTGTTSGGTEIVPITNKNTTTSHRIDIPAGTPGNTTIYWSVRGFDDAGNAGTWKQQTVIYSNNVPTIGATINAPANLDVSLEKRNHQFSINSLKDSDDFNYVTLFADVLDSGGTVVPGSKKQIVLDSSLINSPSLIGGTATEKDGSLQGPLNHTTPFNLKISLQPDFATGKFDLTLTKSDGVTNVIKSGQKLLTGRTMQPSSAPAPESFTLRVYPEDRQNTNTLASAPLAGVNDVTEITIPFTSDTRNYLPNLTNVKHDVANRVFSDAEGFNRISVTGHVDDSDPADTVTMYYEIQPKAANYTIQVKNQGGKMIPKFGVATQTFNPKVDKDFAFTYQVTLDLESGNYALLVYGYDSQEGIGDYFEIPFTVDRGGPTIDFVADYTTTGGQTITMSSAQKQLVASDNKAKIYFTPNNYATFEYAGYLIRSGAVKDMRIRGAFTNEVKATFIGVDFGKDPITLMNGEQTDFKLGDVIVFKFKATSATGIVTQKDVRILIADDNSTFDPINDANLPSIP